MSSHSFKNMLMISVFSLLPIASAIIASEGTKELEIQTTTTATNNQVFEKPIEKTEEIAPALVDETATSEKSSVHYIFPAIGSESRLIIKEKDGQRTTQELLEENDDFLAYGNLICENLKVIESPFERVVALIDLLSNTPKYSLNANIEARFSLDAFKIDCLQDILLQPEWQSIYQAHRLDFQPIIQCISALGIELHQYLDDKNLPEYLRQIAEDRLAYQSRMYGELQMRLFERILLDGCHSPQDFLERFEILKQKKEKHEQYLSDLEEQTGDFQHQNRLLFQHSRECDIHNFSVLLYNFIVAHHGLIPKNRIIPLLQEEKKLLKTSMSASTRAQAISKQLSMEKKEKFAFDETNAKIESEKRGQDIKHELQSIRLKVNAYKHTHKAYITSIKKCIELQKQLLAELDETKKDNRETLIKDQAFYLQVLHMKRDVSDVDAIEAVLDLEQTVTAQLSEEGEATDLNQIYKKILVLITTPYFLETYPHFFVPFAQLGHQEEGIKRARVIQEIMQKFPLNFNEKVRFASFLSIATGDESELMILLKEKKERDKKALEEKKAREKAERELLQESLVSKKPTKQPVKPKKAPKKALTKTEIQPAPAPAPVTDWVDEKNTSPKYQMTREKRVEEHKKKSSPQDAPASEPVRIVVEDFPIAPKPEPKTLEPLLKLNSEIDLVSLYNLKGKEAKLERQIQRLNWDMSKEEIAKYLKALGCTIRTESVESEEKELTKARTGHGSHHVLSLDIKDVLFKEKHLAFLIDEKEDAAAAPKKKTTATKKEQMNIPVFVLKQWQGDHVPHYIRERLMLIRNMLYDFKMEEGAKAEEKKP